MNIHYFAILVKFKLVLASSQLKTDRVSISQMFLYFPDFFLRKRIIDSFPKTGITSVGRYWSLLCCFFLCYDINYQIVFNFILIFDSTLLHVWSYKHIDRFQRYNFRVIDSFSNSTVVQTFSIGSFDLLMVWLYECSYILSVSRSQYRHIVCVLIY